MRFPTLTSGDLPGVAGATGLPIETRGIELVYELTLNIVKFTLELWQAPLI